MQTQYAAKQAKNPDIPIHPLHCISSLKLTKCSVLSRGMRVIIPASGYSKIKQAEGKKSTIPSTKRVKIGIGILREINIRNGTNSDT